MPINRSIITNLRWGVVPYTHGSGLHIGCGATRVFPNAIGLDTVHGAAQFVVQRLDRLPTVADGSYDFVVVADALKRVAEPRALLAEAWRVLTPGGFLILVSPTPVAFGWLTDAASGAPDHALIDQLTLGAQRVDVISKLPAGAGRVDARLPAADKTVGVVRTGAYGDALWAASLLPHLKAEGYQVTFYADPPGEAVLRHDPHIDALMLTGSPCLGLDDLGPYWAHEQKRYDRWINLAESVEKNLLAVCNDLRFFWPASERRRIFNRNYLEAVHDLAGVPHDFQQRFYATDAEREQAIERRSTGTKHAVIAPSGSTLPKFWPYVPDLAGQLIARGFEVWVLGDLRGCALPEHASLHVIGTQWPIREAMAFTQQAELVIGEETALTNAVAQESMRKIVLLSHSTEENLTKHWVNTTALHGDAACYPCHQIHYNQNGWHHCNHNKATDGAQCQADITPERVIAAVDQHFGVPVRFIPRIAPGEIETVDAVHVDGVAVPEFLKKAPAADAVARAVA